MTDMFSQKNALKALETYGTDFDRWPDQDLANYVKTQPSFAGDIKRAAMLDAELAAQTKPAPSPDLKNRILMAAAAQAQPSLQSSAQVIPLKPKRAAGFSAITRIAALFLVSAIVGGSLWAARAPSPDESDITYVASLEAETEAWLDTANDLGMADLFLWVETDGSTG